MIHAAILAMALLGPQEDKEAADALAKFKTEMKNPSTPARAAAVSELARVQHQKTLNAILPFLHQDTGEVRKAAAAALGAFMDYKKIALPSLLGAITPNQKETMVLESIFLSVGKLGDETTLPTVHKYCEDKDPKVAKAALTAVAQIRKLQSIDFIIDLMKRLEKYLPQPGGDTGGVGGVNIPGGGDDPNRTRAQEVIPACIATLKAITKESWPSSKEWQLWWAKKKGSFSLDK
ncbi:MAG TPA: HEAT repeat domain-containing protein [Planctomycetota bacterium]